MADCEDCGEEVPKDRRRVRCPRCKMLVCPHCRWHAHELNIQLDRQAAAKKEQAS